MKQKYFLFFFLMLASVGLSWGQTKKLTGVVKDDKGEALPGASVVVKGTTNGAMTGLDGSFAINNAKKGDVIVVSFIGYAKQEIRWDGNAKLSVKLAEDSKLMDEVVVVGYGSTRKKDLTGALTSMKPNLTEAAQAVSVDGLLGGKIAGLVVSNASATPGAASSVTIRGASSLRGDNQPLYVIDNIPQASTGEFGGSGAAGDFEIAQDPLASLNPADIEDITVLKDASSTAIYGSRGANGVILITTKKGKRGQAKINFTANYTIANATRLMDMLSLSESAQYINSRIADPTQHDYKVVGDEVRYLFTEAGDMKSSYDPNDPSTYTVLQYRNWQKEIYRSAFSQNYALNINGGGDKTTYYVSAGFKNIEGVVRQTGLKQGDIRLNLSSEIAKNLRATIILSGSIRKNDMMAGGNTRGGATGAISRTALDYVPFIRPNYDPNLRDENLTTVFSWINDYADIANDKTFKASLDLRWRISDRLSYNLRTGGNVNTNDRSRWYGKSLYMGMINEGYLALADLAKSNYSIENILNYNADLAKWARLDATVGITYDDYNFLNKSTIANQFTMFEFREKGLHMAGNIKPAEPVQRDYQLLSYLGRVNLSLFDRYLITASLRADGSSKFAKGNRWGYFPSASLAWRVNQEKFLKDVKAIDDLKLRLSYGVTGNQSINPYSTFSMYGGGASYGDGSGGILSTMQITNLSNSSLVWEKTASWNLGLDFALFGSRLSGTLDFYNKKTTDLLISRGLPGSAGFPSTFYNQGSLNNQGVEFSLSAEVLKGKDFSWTISGNIGVNKAKIQDLGMDPASFGVLGERIGYYGNTLGDHFGQAHVFFQGEASGLFLGYRTQGIVQKSDIVLGKNANGEDVYAGTRYVKADGSEGVYTSAIGRPQKAGDLKFVDLNGDGKIDANDRTILGDPNPDFTYGFQTQFRYKTLSFSASFTGVKGRDVINTGHRYNSMPGTRSQNIRSDVFREMWTESNPSTTQPSSLFEVENYVLDRYVEDASYLRCADITLGYALPKSLVKKIGVSQLSLTASVKNAFVITNYTGYDPEVNSFAFDGLRPGVDMSSYPSPRSFVLGLSLTF